jgi:hypothetical protein
MFGGSLILTVGFIHVLGHGAGALAELEEFPVGPALCLAGILFMILLDQVSLSLVHRRSATGGKSSVCFLFF